MSCSTPGAQCSLASDEEKIATLRPSSPAALRCCRGFAAAAQFKRLETAIVPGDVLLVKGTGQLTAIGANGGFLGHVLLVLASPVAVDAASPEAQDYADVWPAGAFRLWKIATMESTRSYAGLHHSELLVYREVRIGRLVLLGEIVRTAGATELLVVDAELVEVWQSPSALREDFRPDIMASVLRDMKDCQADWSLSTAARAVFRSAALDGQYNRSGLLRQMTFAWEQAPICTSIVITFWQRYLCSYAAATGVSDVGLVMKYMPLKADRGLPGELIRTMRSSGWIERQAIGLSI